MSKEPIEADLNPRLDPVIVRRTLSGYEQVNRLAAAERRSRLRAMSDEEARAIFDDLCATAWRLRSDGGDRSAGNERRLGEKIRVRAFFEQLAKARGLL